MMMMMLLVHSIVSVSARCPILCVQLDCLFLLSSLCCVLFLFLLFLFSFHRTDVILHCHWRWLTDWLEKNEVLTMFFLIVAVVVVHVCQCSFFPPKVLVHLLKLLQSRLDWLTTLNNSRRSFSFLTFFVVERRLKAPFGKKKQHHHHGTWNFWITRDH